MCIRVFSYLKASKVDFYSYTLYVTNPPLEITAVSAYDNNLLCIPASTRIVHNLDSLTLRKTIKN